MEDPCCLVCCKRFSETEVVPKVCDCGYSICIPCLAEIIQRQKNCPKCKEPSSKVSVNDFPTNFSLCSLLKKPRVLLSSKSHRKHSFEHLKGLFLSIKEKLKENIVVRNSLKSMVIGDLSKIEHIIESDEDELNEKETNKLLNELWKDLNKVQNVIECCKFNISASFSLNQYKNVKMFLYEILIRLHKGEDIFAMTRVCGQLKYGKISSDDDLLLIHALTLPEISKDASVIWLEDFKKCVGKVEFLTFIHVLSSTEGQPTLQFCFEMRDSSLSLQFIKLCTGENGPIYKGTIYVGSNTKSETSTCINYYIHPSKQIRQQPVLQTVLMVDNYMLNDEKTEGMIDYDLTAIAKNNEETFSPPNMVVQGFPFGRFQVSVVNQECDLSNVIGVDSKWSGNPLINNKQGSAIEDCGIAFRLK